jgi:hypothetical protein
MLVSDYFSFWGCLLAYRLIGLIADLLEYKIRENMVLGCEGCGFFVLSLLGFAALNTNLRSIPYYVQIPHVAVGWVECNETQQVKGLWVPGAGCWVI